LKRAGISALRGVDPTLQLELPSSPPKQLLSSLGQVPEVFIAGDMEKKSRTDTVVPIPPQTGYIDTANWRPWQLSPLFLVPLIVISAGLAATLEALAQISNHSYRDEDLRALWRDWYCEGRGDCVPESDIPGLSLSDMTFENISSSKTGILTFLQPNTLSAASTFAWLYFPTLSAVFYAIFWQVVDDEVKRMEPFYQASRSTGAKGDRSIFASYISIPPVLVPLQAIRWRQMAVFLSSMTYVLVGFVTPILQSQIFQLQPHMVQLGYIPRFGTRLEPLTRQGFEFPRRNGDGPIIAVFTDELDELADLAEVQNEGVARIVVHVDPTFARAQEAILLAAALSGSLLLWVTMRRQSGMLSDTNGMAALSSLAAGADPDFLEQIAIMGGPRGPDVLKETVVHLGWGQGSVAGEPASLYGFWFEPLPTEQRLIRRGSKVGARIITAFKAFGASILRWALGSSGKHYQILHYAIGLSVLGNIVLIIMILITGGTERPSNTADDAFSRTVRGASRSGIVSAAINLILVSIIKTLWVVVEEQTIVLSPYRSLDTHPRKAWPLLERDYSAIVPGARTFYAFKDGQVLLGCVTGISLLLELGLICFGIVASMSEGTAYNADASWIVHWIAFTICIITIMFIATTSRIWLAGFPFMPRNPDTIAARLSYVCKSRRLLEDVKPVAPMTSEERHAYLRSIEGLYGLVEAQPGWEGLERITDGVRG